MKIEHFKPKTCLALPMFLMVLFPSSTNYTLRSYEFGGGGGTEASSNYVQQGVLGEQTTNDASSSSYSLGAGLAYAQQSNAPGVSLFNDDHWYNKLRAVIDPQNNPTDTVYEIAISSDNFSTTQYVQSNDSIGSTENYQDYATWGGSSGTTIIGLNPGTTYQVKVKARQGEFTESPYGPSTSAATETSSVSFDIDVSATDTETAPPYILSMGSLSSGSVTTAGNKIWVDFDTNAESGGYVYIAGQYGGLRSTNLNYTISSATTNLDTADEGYGLQSASATAVSGSLTALAPYNNNSDNVGVVDSTVRELYDSNNAAITGGRASMVLKAKASGTTPSSNDYTDTLTIIAAGTF